MTPPLGAEAARFLFGFALLARRVADRAYAFGALPLIKRCCVGIIGWVLQDQADVLKDDSKYQESIDTLKQSLDIKEDQPYAHSALGWSYYGLEKYDDAEEAFNQAIKLKGDYADAYYGLGRALQGQDKPEDARVAYQKAIDNGSTSAKDALDSLK